MSFSPTTKATIPTPMLVRSFFPWADERNSDYTYIARPKKKVVLMGTKAFTNFLISTQGHIGNRNDMVGVLQNWMTALTARMEGGGPNRQQAVDELEETQHELAKTQVAIIQVKKSFVKAKKEWTKSKDWIIRHVVTHQCLARSSQLYGGHLRRQAQEEGTSWTRVRADPSS